MTCRGILPDGTECTCPDEFVNKATGLCASCAAPDSTALVPVGETGLMADPAMDALLRTLSPKAQAFLHAYTETRTIKKAAKAAGISRQSHYHWMENTPGYPELFEIAERDVLDWWRDHFADKIKDGLKECTYDAEGSLKQTRVRESEGLLKALMVAKDPDFTPDKGKHEGVTIIINQTQEWEDHPTYDAKKAEIIKNAEVIVAKEIAGSG